MALIKLIWTLMCKNWRHKMRHAPVTFVMAFIVPVACGIFLSFARNLFVPPATFGIAQPTPLRSLTSALEYGRSNGKDKVVLVDSSFTGGEISRVLDQLEVAINDADPAIRVIRASHEDDIARVCRSTLRGVTTCFNAIVMRSSPEEPSPAGSWNYTIRSDSSHSNSPIRFNVESNSNPSQVYMIPMQRAIDRIIGQMSNPDADLLANTREMPFTSLTQDERADWIREVYQQTLVNVLAVMFIATIIWITYDLTGFIATERESGMSTLIDAMIQVKQPWMAQAARIVAHHLSFSIVYAPAWIVSSIIVRAGVYTNTNVAILLFSTIIAGLALSSFAILVASFFKKAQLSGITAFLATLILGILAQSLTAPSTGIVAVLSALFTPCSYVYLVTAMSRFEKERLGASLLDIPPNSPWEIQGIILWVFMIFQIFLYPFIGFLVERYLYGTTSKGRTITRESLGENAVQLEGFTKIYNPGLFSKFFHKDAKPVVAVNKLSFNALKGQIVALLGANGSGKSTSLDAIAGLNKLTGGSITIDGSGGLGVAPQRNVMWDDLSVEEHILIFNRLKAPNARASPQEITELIDAIDLTKKRKAFSKTLSGGQKRKLQLGMMLTGGSSVCCVDEVSSGIDPLSRKKLWDILLAERGRRTMLLTTHFLDEADLLSDKILILSKGTLRASGSSVELKNSLGGGYKVHIQKSPSLSLKTIPDIDGVTKKETLDLITYNSPSSNLSATVIKKLETAGVLDYRFSGPTIEDVFLSVADEIRDEEASARTVEGVELREFKSSDGPHDAANSLMNGTHVNKTKQAMILFMKRLTVFKRNWLPYVAAFLIPIIAAALTSLYIIGQDPPGCSPADQAADREIEDAFSQIDAGNIFVLLVGPASKISTSTISRLFLPIFSGLGGRSEAMAQAALSTIKQVDTFAEFQDYISNNRKNITNGLWLGDDSNTEPTMAFLADLFVTSPVTGQQILDMVLTNSTIQTTWSAFDIPFSPNTGDSLNLVIYMGLALSISPAFYSLYPSSERRGLIRSLEYSNGVSPLSLWGAYGIFDFIIALTSSAILTAVWAGMSQIWFNLSYVFVVLFLYAIASILFSYVVSLFTKSQLSTFAWAAGLQVLCFLVYLIAYLLVETYSPVAQIDSNLLVVHYVISALAPMGSATRAMFLALNLFSSACDGNEVSANPGDIQRYGGPILYLVVQSVLYFSFIVWFDAGSAGSIFRNVSHNDKDTKSNNIQTDAEVGNEEVDNEYTQVTEAKRENGLRVVNLTKSFKNNTAVDNVTFDIKRGEVFALLGPNGAGKSTTISLIRGDIKPSRNGGDIFVEDVSVSKNLTAARANLGVCPQFDALDFMTVRDHLEFYAKVRGIPDIEHNVFSVLHAVGLTAFSTRMAHALSGGNKRKLSLGIALMGNPSVIVLDEPSSGLDAAAKRVMWKTLANIVTNRSILLTTHSMEEADALASRAGIMARRMLVLDTPDNLRHSFGDALHIHIVCSNAPRTTQEQMGNIIDWVRHTFPSADVEEKTYHGQLRFSVRASQVMAAIRGRFEPEDAGHEKALSQNAIGNLVVLLEEKKAELGIGHLSVSPTTLDQVFLAVVGKHNIQEEGYEDQKKSFWRKFGPRVSQTSASQ